MMAIGWLPAATTRGFRRCPAGADSIGNSIKPTASRSVSRPATSPRASHKARTNSRVLALRFLPRRPPSAPAGPRCAPAGFASASTTPPSPSNKPRRNRSLSRGNFPRGFPAKANRSRKPRASSALPRRMDAGGSWTRRAKRSSMSAPTTSTTALTGARRSVTRHIIAMPRRSLAARRRGPPVPSSGL